MYRIIGQQLEGATHPDMKRWGNLICPHVLVIKEFGSCLYVHGARLLTLHARQGTYLFAVIITHEVRDSPVKDWETLPYNTAAAALWIWRTGPRTIR